MRGAEHLVHQRLVDFGTAGFDHQQIRFDGYQMFPGFGDEFVENLVIDQRVIHWPLPRKPR